MENAAAEPCREPVEVMTQAAFSVAKPSARWSLSLRTATKECSQQARQLVQDDNNSLESRETTIRESLDHLNSAYEKMSASLSSSAAMNRQLNNDIGQAVMSMQFQDRVNQRITAYRGNHYGVGARLAASSKQLRSRNIESDY